MNFDPQKFFIGLMDFFSILLPCAMLTYLLMDEVGPVVLGDRFAKLTGAEAWAAFLFASYLFGHLVFLLGSWLDEFYGWARRYMRNTQNQTTGPVILASARRCFASRWPRRTRSRANECPTRPPRSPSPRHRNRHKTRGFSPACARKSSPRGPGSSSSVSAWGGWPAPRWAASSSASPARSAERPRISADDAVGLQRRGSRLARRQIVVGGFGEVGGGALVLGGGAASATGIGTLPGVPAMAGGTW
jgi:hypothetical protein